MEPPNAAGAAGSVGESPGEDGEPAAGPMPSSGVCGFSEPVTYGTPAADGMVDVPPSDPNIFYMGRIDCQSQGPAFAFPAASVRVRFDGNALDLRLRDSGTGTPQSTNYYDVSIDGAAPTRLEATPGDNVYAWRAT